MKQNEPVSPSFMARYTCVGMLLGVFAIWGKYSFIPEIETPAFTSVDITTEFKFPMYMTIGYMMSLPALNFLLSSVLKADKNYMKALLKESMVLYNVLQVILNGWIVYEIMHALIKEDHPFIGDTHSSTLCAYAVWIHYCDKYLEFFDTYFMVLRGKMDQVSFLHVYHHFSIAWAWWIGVSQWSAGDAYFGALLNSIIHVMMYAYYGLALLGISCPWKQYLTQAQLLQFVSVIVYTIGIIALPRAEDQKLFSNHYICCGVQVFEMVSLFVLFSMFYKKAYKSKASKKVLKVEEEDDACQAAVAGITSSAQVLAKDARKVVDGVQKYAPVGAVATTKKTM